jgi:hypothetical protein
MRLGLGRYSGVRLAELGYMIGRAAAGSARRRPKISRPRAFRFFFAAKKCTGNCSLICPTLLRGQLAYTPKPFFCHYLKPRPTGDPPSRIPGPVTPLQPLSGA